MRVFRGDCKEISVMGCDVQRLLSLGSRFDPIEITFNAKGFVQPSSILQMQPAGGMDFDSNLQVGWLPSLLSTRRSTRAERG